MQDFEKLGVFYLGREYDLARKAAEDSPILYDSKDLVTHAVCVGMTGSGKTGLCISLIEEAAIDGIPCLLYTSPSQRDRTRSRMPSSACKKKQHLHATETLIASLAVIPS